jgi:hypothetical protein
VRAVSDANGPGSAARRTLTTPMLSQKIFLMESDPAVADQTRAACGAADSGWFNVEGARQLSEDLERLSKKGIDTVLLALSLPEIPKKVEGE